MELHYFELSDDKSSKFWEITTQGAELTTRWGRIGTDGQSKTKTFQTVEETLAAAQKMIAGKIKKGYTEISAEVNTGSTAKVVSELTTSPNESETDTPTKQSESWERVFIRDVKADSPEDIGEAMRYARPPFESDSGGGGTGPPHLLPENTRKWFIQLWDKNHGWCSLFCNCADGKTVFDASSKSSRLQVVHFGYDDQKRGWFFRCKRAGKNDVDFELPVRAAGDLNKAKFKAAELANEFLDICQSGQDVIEKLCREFGIAKDAVRLDCSGERPEIVDATGDSAKSRIGAHSSRTAPGLEWGDDPAADLLEEGVEALDPQLIQQAIEQGADLNKLPDRNVTPLKVLLHACPDPRVQDCVEVLVKSGLALEDESGKPAVMEHTAHYESEERVIGKLRVLVSSGANVDGVDARSGETVMFENVRRRRTGIVRCLIELCADPTIENQSGQSVIDIINEKIAQAPPAPGVSIGVLPRRREDSSNEWQALLDVVLNKSLLDEAKSASAEIDHMNAYTDQVDPSVSLVVRQNISEQTSASVDDLTPQTNLANEFSLDEDGLASILLPVCVHFKISMTPLIQQVESACRFDERGCLMETSKQRLKELLPSFPIDDWEELTETDVFLSVAFIEAIVTAAIDLRMYEDVNIDDLPIGGLDERQQRLLLTGTYRYLWQSASNHRMRLELSDALNAIEVFADTGKAKTALSRARSSFRGTYIHSRKPWQNAPESIAIDKALENEDLKAALCDMVHAMKQILEISTQKAMNRLADFAAELVAPAGVHQAFQVKWRSPHLVKLAQEMYNSRDFSKMPELANGLQQLGCENELILKHCRDADRWHMRGCWVVDAILDGSWEKTAKKPPSKKKSSSKKKPLLQQLPKSAQLSLRTTADFSFVDLEFAEFIAKLWDVELYETIKRGNASKFVEKRRNKLEEKFPSLTAEQIDTLLSLQQIDRELQHTCITRRVLREDPSEVGHGMSLLHRVRDAMLGPQRRFDDVGPLCSTHHLDIARKVSSEFLSVMSKKDFKNHDYIDLRQLAFASIMAGESEMLPRLWSEMTKGKKPPWLTAWYVVLKAMSDRDPSAFAEGLQEFLGRFRRLNQDHDAVINFDAHGLYRLAESLDPKLVAQFDTQQSYPWDPEFHAWCDANPDPLLGLDLSEISTNLHQVVIERNPPIWMQQLLKPPTSNP